mgnify:CR=1 FL=1
MKLIKTLSLMVIVSLLLGVVAGCGPQQAEAPEAEPPEEEPVESGETEGSDEPLQLALLVALSGDVKTFGDGARRGMEMAIAEWNEKGGVLGREVEMVVGDTKCDAQEASNVANKVINQDQVKYIVGAICSSASIPISEVADPAGVIMVSPASTNPQEIGRAHV